MVLLDVYKRQPGEQSNQYSRADNNNWNGTLTVNYRLAKIHMLTFNHVLNTFRRSNTSLLAKAVSYTHLDVYKRQVMHYPAGIDL